MEEYQELDSIYNKNIFNDYNKFDDTYIIKQKNHITKYKKILIKNYKNIKKQLNEIDNFIELSNNIKSKLKNNKKYKKINENILNDKKKLFEKINIINKYLNNINKQDELINEIIKKRNLKMNEKIKFDEEETEKEINLILENEKKNIIEQQKKYNKQINNKILKNDNNIIKNFNYKNKAEKNIKITNDKLNKIKEENILQQKKSETECINKGYKSCKAMNRLKLDDLVKNHIIQVTKNNKQKEKMEKDFENHIENLKKIKEETENKNKAKIREMEDKINKDRKKNENTLNKIKNKKNEIKNEKKKYTKILLLKKKKNQIKKIKNEMDDLEQEKENLKIENKDLENTKKILIAKKNKVKQKIDIQKDIKCKLNNFQLIKGNHDIKQCYKKCLEKEDCFIFNIDNKKCHIGKNHIFKCEQTSKKNSNIIKIKTNKNRSDNKKCSGYKNVSYPNSYKKENKKFEFCRNKCLEDEDCIYFSINDSKCELSDKKEKCQIKENNSYLFKLSQREFIKKKVNKKSNKLGKIQRVDTATFDYPQKNYFKKWHINESRNTWNLRRGIRYKKWLGKKKCKVTKSGYYDEKNRNCKLNYWDSVAQKTKEYTYDNFRKYNSFDPIRENQGLPQRDRSPSGLFWKSDIYGNIKKPKTMQYTDIKSYGTASKGRSTIDKSKNCKDPKLSGNSGLCFLNYKGMSRSKLNDLPNSYLRWEPNTVDGFNKEYSYINLPETKKILNIVTKPTKVDFKKWYWNYKYNIMPNYYTKLPNYGSMNKYLVRTFKKKGGKYIENGRKICTNNIYTGLIYRCALNDKTRTEIIKNLKNSENYESYCQINKDADRVQIHLADRQKHKFSGGHATYIECKNKDPKIEKWGLYPSGRWGIDVVTTRKNRNDTIKKYIEEYKKI